MPTIVLRTNRYSLAQLRIIRNAWAWISTADQNAFVARAERNIAVAATNAPQLSLLLPDNCSPAAITRFATFATAWPSLSPALQSEFVDQAITLRDGHPDAKAAR